MGGAKINPTVPQSTLSNRYRLRGVRGRQPPVCMGFFRLFHTIPSLPCPPDIVCGGQGAAAPCQHRIVRHTARRATPWSSFTPVHRIRKLSSCRELSSCPFRRIIRHYTWRQAATTPCIR